MHCEMAINLVNNNTTNSNSNKAGSSKKRSNAEAATIYRANTLTAGTFSNK